MTNRSRVKITTFARSLKPGQKWYVRPWYDQIWETSSVRVSGVDGLIVHVWVVGRERPFTFDNTDRVNIDVYE